MYSHVSECNGTELELRTYLSNSLIPSGYPLHHVYKRQNMSLNIKQSNTIRSYPYVLGEQVVIVENSNVLNQIIKQMDTNYIAKKDCTCFESEMAAYLSPKPEFGVQIQVKC